MTRTTFLCLLVLFSTLIGFYPTGPAEATSGTSVGVWSDHYASSSIVDPSIVPGTSTITVDVNATNVPKFIGNTATSFNGLDITVDYDPSVIRVTQSARLVYNGMGEDTVVSVIPVRPPDSETGKALVDFDPATGPAVKFIDLDLTTKYAIGETLVLDADRNDRVSDGDSVVSQTPPRGPTPDEIGRDLLFEPSLRFIDPDSDGIYLLGDTVVLDANDTFQAERLTLSCHFYEGCLFDNTKGTPLEGRTVTQLLKSCDAGCSTITPGRSGISLVLLAFPLTVPDSGLSGTLFRLKFSVQSSGLTSIAIASSTLTSPATGKIPHVQLHGYFSGSIPDAMVSKLVVEGADTGRTVAQGRPLTVHVTAEGQFTPPPLNVDVFYGQTKISSLLTSSGVPTTFTWDTTEVPDGNYVMSALVTIPDYEFRKHEVNTANNLLVNGTVIVRIGTDIAVTSVDASPVEVIPGSISESVVQISVTIANYSPTAEMVAVVVNATRIGIPDGTPIAQPISEIIPAREEKNFAVSWTTEGWSTGDYFMIAAVSLALSAPELDSLNNERTGPSVVHLRANRLPDVTILHQSEVSPNVVPVAVQFDASASRDPDGFGGEIFSWNFGDGSPTVSGPRGVADQVVHTYTEFGTFTVRLSVVDKHGGETVKTSQITVRAPASPTPFLTAYLPYIGAGAAAGVVIFILLATGRLQKMIGRRATAPAS